MNVLYKTGNNIYVCNESDHFVTKTQITGFTENIKNIYSSGYSFVVENDKNEFFTCDTRNPTITFEKVENFSPLN